MKAIKLTTTKTMVNNFEYSTDDNTKTKISRIFLSKPPFCQSALYK